MKGNEVGTCFNQGKLQGKVGEEIIIYVTRMMAGLARGLVTATPQAGRTVLRNNKRLKRLNVVRRWTYKLNHNNE